MNLTYTMQGDYLLPNLEVPESPKVGKYGMLRRSFLRSLGTIPYELMCGINKRIPRIYLNGEDETEVLQYIV